MSSITIKILNMRVLPLEGSVVLIQTTFCSFPTAFLIDRPLPLAQLQLFTNVPALRFRECCVQLSSPHVSTPAYCSGLFCLLACDLHALLISSPQAWSCMLNVSVSKRWCCRHGLRGKRLRFVGMRRYRSMLLAPLHCPIDES